MEVLVAVALLGLVGAMLTQITISGTSTMSGESHDRALDASTAQLVAVSFGRDVQGAAGIAATACGTAGGATDLVSLVASSDGSVVTYRAVPDAGEYDLTRSACTSAGVGTGTGTVVPGLSGVPTVTCATTVTVACTPGSAPRRVTLSVDRTSTFGFDVAGDRRPVNSGTLTPTLPAQLIALGGTTPLTVTGNGNLSVVGNAYVNATASAAVVMSGNNARMSVSGEFRIQQGGTCSGCSATKNTPFPPGSFPSALPDPLKYLPLPSESGLTTFTCPGSTCGYQGPGVYPKQLAITGNATLAAGTYVLRKGLAISGNGTITGAGVHLFNGCGAGITCAPATYGSITVSGGSSIDLSPPTTGTYRGILLHQPAANTNTVSISGGADAQLFSGVLYAPAATTVSLGAGGGGLTLGTVVGQNLSVTGNGVVQVDG